MRTYRQASSCLLYTSVDDIYIDAIARTGFYVITPSLGYYPMFLFYLMLSNYVVDGLNAFMEGELSPDVYKRQQERH